MFKVGLIGFGYWGPNLARNFAKHKEAKLVAVADVDAKRRSLALENYPGVRLEADPNAILQATDIDVVAIATPVYTHFEFAVQALKHGKHVWLEKPLTLNSEDGKFLVELADKLNKIVFVDHTFIFTPAVRKIKECVDSGALGDLYYYDSIRVNLGLFQSDVNVIWDLAPHDLSILEFILGRGPQAVSATGKSHFPERSEDVGYITAYYSDNLIAHLHNNWLSPVKVRKILFGGSKSMLVWDDVTSDEKIKIYDRGVSISQKEGIDSLKASYRMGAVASPVLDNTEALTSAVKYFFDCIKSNTKPVNDAAAGLRIVQILEACDKSMKQFGAPVELNLWSN